MEQGYRIQISEYVDPTPDTVFAYTDPTHDWAQEDHRTLVFHPLNYSYVAYEDIWEAHEMNVNYIQAKIDKMAKEALEKLDRMVYEMNHKHDPQLVTFFPNTEVVENPDGTFTFSASPWNPDAPATPMIFVGGPEPSSQFMADRKAEALAWLQNSDVEASTKPVEQTWDELLYGYRGGE